MSNKLTEQDQQSKKNVTIFNAEKTKLLDQIKILNSKKLLLENKIRETEKKVISQVNNTMILAQNALIKLQSEKLKLADQYMNQTSTLEIEMKNLIKAKEVL